MSFFYTAGIRLYGLGISIASVANEKAKKWKSGRSNWKAELSKKIGGQKNWIWFHCASLGEFEQGRPLIEEIKEKHPEYKILLTFFSPSGYEIRKNYDKADHVCYMPLDTPGNAKAYLDIVRPKMAFFIKYDIWVNHISALFYKKIPVFLVSAIMREDSRFFNSLMSGLYRETFRKFSTVFTQDDETRVLLHKNFGMTNVKVAGDTRFDRAVQLPAKFEPVAGIEEFIAGKRCIVAGSPWPKDEELLLGAIDELKTYDIKWIIAPHEIHPEQIDRTMKESGMKMCRYSTMKKDADVLWIDNVGMLSRLYHYSEIVYIGGGFGSGIHNIQEPAVYGNPVIFGPEYGKFREAVDLLQAGGAAAVMNKKELVAALRKWLDDHELLEKTRESNRQYMQRMAGATAKVMEELEKDHF